MARRSRAMSIGLAHDKAEGPRQLHPEATLPVPSSSHTVSSLRTKKSSHSAILRVLRKLRSPGNSDDEDDDGCPEGDEDNSDLDFGCSGLNSCIDLDASKSSFDEELHISLPPQQHQHQDAQTSLELPTRSASIADSMTSSISSINLSSSECTLSTPTSYSQSASARSSFSTSPTSPTSTNSQTSSQTSKKFFIAQGSPRTNTSHATFNNNSNSSQPHAIIEIAEEQEESEEQAILRRKQEEQAAIEALEAYFAFRRASDTPPPPSSSSTSLGRNGVDVKQGHHQTTSTGATRTVDTSIDSTYERRTSSPFLLPYASPYFATYANDPFPILSMKHYNDVSFTSSVGEHRPLASLKQSPSTAALQPANSIHSNGRVCSSREAVVFPRPPLRTRRSEASLKDARRAETGAATGRRRPSLAPGQLYSNARPRGLTFSNSSPLLSTSNLDHTNDTRFLPTIPSTPTSPNSQIISYNRNTPTSSSSSNFLNFDPSPESPNFKLGEILPSPPRSSSLAATVSSGWPSSINDNNSNSNNRCKAFVIKNDEMVTPSPTKVNFEPNEIYHNTLESYRFPENRSISKSIHSTSITPAVSRSPSTLSLSKITDTNAASSATMAPKVHSPLGSATASRRGSLVSSPPLTLRSRAGSIAASANGNTISRNAIYEYI